VLEALNLTMVTEHRAARAALPSNPTELKLYQVLGPEPVHIDDIRSKTELPIETVSSTLVLMELKGMVRQVGGMNFVAVRETRDDYYE